MNRYVARKKSGKTTQDYQLALLRLIKTPYCCMGRQPVDSWLGAR